MDPACINNAAGRLWTVLARAVAQGGNNRAGDIWAVVLGTGSFPETLQALALVAEMPNQIRRDVAAHASSVNADLLIRPLPDIEDGLSEPLGQGWSHVIAHFQQHTMNDLEHTAEWLRTLVASAVISEVEIDELTIQVADLRGEVEASDIDADLRELLLRHLHHMESALRDVQWRGSDAVREAGEAAFGAMIIEIHLHGEKEKRLPLSKRLLALATGFIVACNVVQAPIELEQTIQRALEPPAAQAPPTGAKPAANSPSSNP